MRKALFLKDLAPLLHRKDGKKGLNQRTLAYRRDWGYMWGIQIVYLPFVPKLKKKQADLHKRYMLDFIVQIGTEWYEPINPCRLEPCTRPEADIEFEYYNEKYYYKLPEGAHFLKR